MAELEEQKNEKRVAAASETKSESKSEEAKPTKTSSNK
jgi:hypothetical protein